MICNFISNYAIEYYTIVEKKCAIPCFFTFNISDTIHAFWKAVFFILCSNVEESMLCILCKARHSSKRSYLRREDALLIWIKSNVY